MFKLIRYFNIIDSIYHISINFNVVKFINAELDELHIIYPYFLFDYRILVLS